MSTTEEYQRARIEALESRIQELETVYSNLSTEVLDKMEKEMADYLMKYPDGSSAIRDNRNVILGVLIQREYQSKNL
jgi:hypothetical protein